VFRTCASRNSVDAGPCICPNIATIFCESGTCVPNVFTHDVPATVFVNFASSLPLSVRVTVLDIHTSVLCAGGVPCANLQCSDISNIDSIYTGHNISNSSIFSLQAQGPVTGSTTKYRTSLFVPKKRQLMLVDGRSMDWGQGTSTGFACQAFDTTNFDPNIDSLVINTEM
jgi:hypothetical protein